MLFQCNEPIHDFYHVEPQTTCLVGENAEQFVADKLLRYDYSSGIVFHCPKKPAKKWSIWIVATLLFAFLAIVLHLVGLHAYIAVLSFFPA